MTQAIEDEGGEVRLDSGVRADPGRRRPRRARRGRRGARTSFRAPSSPRCRLREIVRMTSPRPPAEILDGRARPGATATSSRSRSSSTARTSSPTTGSTSTSRPCASAGIQNYRSLEPVDGARPDQGIASGSSTFCFAGDDLWTMSDDDLVGSPHSELEQLGTRASLARRARLSDPRPEGVPDLRRRLRRARGRRSAAGWTRSRPAAGRPQRASPLQQLGPLDAHRDARRRQPARRRPPRIWEVNAESVYHETDVPGRAAHYRVAPETARAAEGARGRGGGAAHRSSVMRLAAAALAGLATTGSHAVHGARRSLPKPGSARRLRAGRRLARRAGRSSSSSGTRASAHPAGRSVALLAPCFGEGRTALHRAPSSTWRAGWLRGRWGRPHGTGER